jgi:hypothetical protein
MDLNDFTLEKNEQGCFLIVEDKKFNISNIVTITISHSYLQITLYGTEKNIDNNSYCFDFNPEKGLEYKFMNYIIEYFQKNNIPFRKSTDIDIIRDNSKETTVNTDYEKIYKDTETTLKAFKKFIKYPK